MTDLPQGVLDALSHQIDAWNRGDIDAFAQHLALDALYVTGAGPVVGRDTLRRRYRSENPARSMGRLEASVVHAERAAHLVITVLAWSVDGDRAGQGHALVVWREVQGQWQLAYDATVRR